MTGRFYNTYTESDLDLFVADLDFAVEKKIDDTEHRVFFKFDDNRNTFYTTYHHVHHVAVDNHSGVSPALVFYDDTSRVVAEIELEDQGEGYTLTIEVDGAIMVTFHSN